MSIFFDKDLSRVGILEIDAVIWDAASTSLVADSEILRQKHSTKNLCASQNLYYGHRDLLRLLVNEEVVYN